MATDTLQHPNNTSLANRAKGKISPSKKTIQGRWGIKKRLAFERSRVQTLCESEGWVSLNEPAFVESDLNNLFAPMKLTKLQRKTLQWFQLYRSATPTIGSQLCFNWFSWLPLLAIIGIAFIFVFTPGSSILGWGLIGLALGAFA